MENKKSHKEMCYEFEKFKREFYNLFFLIKLLKNSTDNFFEDEGYIENDKYLTKNCLYTLCNMVDVLLAKNVKKIERLYFDYEFKKN